MIKIIIRLQLLKISSVENNSTSDRSIDEFMKAKSKGFNWQIDHEFNIFLLFILFKIWTLDF